MGRYLSCPSETQKRRVQSGVSSALSGLGLSFSTQREDDESYPVSSGIAIPSASASSLSSSQLVASSSASGRRDSEVKITTKSSSGAARSDLSPNSSQAIAALQRLREVRGYSFPLHASPSRFPLIRPSSRHRRTRGLFANKLRLSPAGSLPKASQQTGEGCETRPDVPICSLPGNLLASDTVIVNARRHSEPSQLAAPPPRLGDRSGPVSYWCVKEKASAWTSRKPEDRSLLPLAPHDKQPGSSVSGSSSSGHEELRQEEFVCCGDCKDSQQVQHEQTSQILGTLGEGVRAFLSPRTVRVSQAGGQGTACRNRTLAVQAEGRSFSAPPTEDDARLFLTLLLKMPLHSLPLAPSLMKRIRRHWVEAGKADQNKPEVW